MTLPESVEKQVESMEIHLGDQGKTLSINLKVVQGDVPIDAMAGNIATHFPEKMAMVPCTGNTEDVFAGSNGVCRLYPLLDSY